MRPKQPSAKLGHLGAALRAASTAAAPAKAPGEEPGKDDLIQRKRELVADLCRLLGRRMAQVIPPSCDEGRDGAVRDGASGEPRNGINRLNDNRAAPSAIPAETLESLSPRMKQTLDGLLAGDSEKQIAHKLSLSKHTIHVYVKALYKGFGVCSRGELLSRFIQNASR